jgi:Asp-tRNA(Asn)/Glu-tRNA(Gln) amidotransferase A subunit family amidase
MLSVLDLVRSVKDGTCMPAALVDLCAQAIAAREGEIGAFVCHDIDRARQYATDNADALAASPLAGLPVGIKDIIDTADWPTAYGSPIYAGHRPAADAAIVSLLRRGGAVALGKTVTTEFATLQPAGTRNPHNIAHTPGGSSSGSAAAVAAGMLPLATGTQTAGSVIRPAAYCGVAGFKPSFRLLPMVGIKCFSWSLDTLGLFAARIDDIAYAAEVASGRELRTDTAHDLAPPRLAVLRTPDWDEASPAMQDALLRAARAAEKAGAQIVEIDMPAPLRDAYDVHSVVQNFEAARAFAFEYDRHRDRLGPIVRTLLDEAKDISARDYDAARRTTKRARRTINDLLPDGTVILTPSAPGAAPHGLDATGSPLFNKLWTLMGAPCVNVPGLHDAAGMPLGVQVVGRFARDAGTLAAAAFIERAMAAHAS